MLCDISIAKRTTLRKNWFRQLDFTPRRGQQAVYDALDVGKRYIGHFCYPRGGKSYGIAKWVGAMLMFEDIHAWIVAPTYLLGSKEFGYVWNDYLETGKLKMAEHKHFDVRGGNMMLQFPWGSFLQVISADNQTALRAEELDILVLAEASALDETIFERHLFARTERRKGIVITPTTPKGYNWLYRSFRVPSLHPGHKDLKGQDNPAYDPAFASFVVSADPDWGDIYEPGIYDDDAIARAKRTLPPQIYKEQFCGDFASYAGLIYHFDPLVHECAPFSIPEDWTYVIGYDHGADNPTAIMFGAYGPDGTLYWWDEVYTAGLSASEYVSHINRRMVGKSISALMIDSSAKQVRIEFAKLGLTTNTPVDKQIDARIIRMTQLMRDGKMKVLRGRCPNFVDEIQSWEWDEDSPGKPRPRQRCHALDAAGYATLADVRLPGSDVIIDPDHIPNEPPLITRAWKAQRKKIREIADAKRYGEIEDTLMDDPFEEVIGGGGYEPPWV